MLRLKKSCRSNYPPPAGQCSAKPYARATSKKLVLSFIAQYSLVAWNTSLVSWGQLSLISFMCTPRLTHWDGWMRNREGLALERPIVWPDSFRYSMCGGCNIEYQIYLKIIGITWDFWFSRVIQVTLKTQHKGKIHLDEYSNCRTSHNPNPNRIPGTGVYNILTITRLGVPHGQEGEHGLQPTQAHCSLRNSLASCVVYVLSVGLSHIFMASASTAQQ